MLFSLKDVINTLILEKNNLMRYYLLVSYISINMSNSVIVSAGAAETTHILHILKISAKTDFC